jgi:hypothetical protein
MFVALDWFRAIFACMKKIFSLLFFGIALLMFFGKGDFVFAKDCLQGGVTYNCPDDYLSCDVLGLPGCTRVSDNVQSDTNACCKIQHSFTFEGITFYKDWIIGEQYKKNESGYCLIDGRERQLTADIENQAPGAYPGPYKEYFYKKWGMVCLVNAIYNVTDWVFYFMMVAGGLSFMAGGARMFFALGDVEKIKKGKRILWYTLAALILGLLAKILPAALTTVVGG